MSRIMLPPPRIPVIDQRTGVMSQAWYAFFAQFLQGAGDDIVSLAENVEGLFIDGAMNGPPLAALDEIRKRVTDLEADNRPDPAAVIDALSKRIADLETELSMTKSPLAAIEELRKRVADIETDLEMGL